MIVRRWLAPAAAAALAAFAGLPLEARPGGGESFGTPGGGGGGDGDGDLIFFLLRIWIEIVFRYPAFGVPATVVLIFLIWRIKKRGAGDGEEAWDSSPVAATSITPPPPPARRYNLDGLIALDENFSPVLFEDFAYALFAKAHQARSEPKALASLAPYLSEAARRELAARPPRGAAVSRVIVGAMRLSFVDLPEEESGEVRVNLEFTANLSLAAGGREETRYVRERWLLRRSAAARSRPPEAQREFGCPKCGAPYVATEDSRCAYCDTVVTGGRFDWYAAQIVLIESRSRAPSLRGTVPEKGTHLPTIYQAGIETRLRRLFAEDSADAAAAIEAFGKRFGMIFHELGAAWSGLELGRARPFLSDSLFDYLHYWIEAYRSQGLRNRLEDFRITRWEFVKVTRDRYFDAVTLRFWAIGRDSVIEQSSGRVVGGDAERARPYSEYWTFIRGRGVHGQASAERRCPNCGAGLDVNMAGVCSHCETKITRGDFDWVLSTIQQDEVYGG